MSIHLIYHKEKNVSHQYLHSEALTFSFKSWSIFLLLTSFTRSFNIFKSLVNDVSNMLNILVTFF